MAYPVFPIIPAFPMLYRQEYMTDAMESWNSEEQRVKLRNTPRSAAELRYILNRYDVSLYQAALYKNVFRHNDPDALLRFIVPLWWDAQQLAGDLGNGSGTINCTTTNYEWAAGEYAVIIAAARLYDRRGALKPDDYEAVEISIVGAGSLTLADNTVADWAAGDWLIPGRIGFIEDAPGLQDLNDGAIAYEGSVRLALEAVAEALE
jgi:hypothetical protein